jgi:hypothetical protein
MLGTGVLAAFAFWFMPRVEIPQLVVPDVPVAGSSAPADAPMNFPAERPVVIKNNPAPGVDSPDSASPVAVAAGAGCRSGSCG